MTATAVRVRLSLDDVVDLQNFLQRPLMLMVTAIGWAAIAVGLVLLLVNPSPALGLAALAYGSLDLAIVQFRPLRRWLVARRASRLVGTEWEFELDPVDGLRWTETGGGGTIGWSSLTHVREDRHLLAFMAGGALRASVPKRAFQTAGEMAAFRDEARKRMTVAGGA